jgi:hypothetical protein
VAAERSETTEDQRGQDRVDDPPRLAEEDPEQDAGEKQDGGDAHQDERQGLVVLQAVDEKVHDDVLEGVADQGQPQQYVEAEEDEVHPGSTVSDSTASICSWE